MAANGICVHDDGTCRQRNGRRKGFEPLYANVVFVSTFSILIALYAIIIDILTPIFDLVFKNGDSWRVPRKNSLKQRITIISSLTMLQPEIRLLKAGTAHSCYRKESDNLCRRCDVSISFKRRLVDSHRECNQLHPFELRSEFRCFRLSENLSCSHNSRPHALWLEHSQAIPQTRSTHSIIPETGIC